MNTGINYYGQRLRTLVVPPMSGNYTFWISSDDTSELFVSTDETPANAAPTAWVSSWTDSMIWTDEPNQQSAPVYLEAGRRYYMEALHQQGGGGDNLAVRWQLPDGAYEQPMTAVSPAGTLMIPFDGVDRLPGIYWQTDQSHGDRGHGRGPLGVRDQSLAGHLSLAGARDQSVGPQRRQAAFAPEQCQCGAQ